MATVNIFPNTMFGRNRNQIEYWVGYVDTDATTVSSPTVAALAETDATPNISLDSVNNEIDIPADGAYKITVALDQTGASSLVQIYDVTGAAVIATSPATEGAKHVVGYIRTTVDTAISVRVDDQAANGTTATTGIVLVERIGAVFT